MYVMKHVELNEDLYQYIIDKSIKEHPVLSELREITQKLPLGIMQIPREQAQFIQFLIRLISAKRVLEIGTFTGYSALAMSLALPDDGQVTTCDLNKESTDIAQTYWKKANQETKIKLLLGKALDTLNGLIQQDPKPLFDFIFIDADKTNYRQYYEMALDLLEPHGLIMIDNVLWEGKVIYDEPGGQLREIKLLNDFIKEDKRVYISLLPISDGVFLIQKKR